MVRFLPASARAETPWRNGGGRTREVDSVPAGAADFHWRISIADVAADGPFSAFTGYDRIITVLRGAGMALSVDGVTTEIDTAYRPFPFSGDAETHCRLLDGPVVDLNVIAVPSAAAGIEIRTAPATLADVGIAYVIALDGSITVAEHRLAPLDAVRIDDEPTVAVDRDTHDRSTHDLGRPDLGPHDRSTIAVVRLRRPDASLR